MRTKDVSLHDPLTRVDLLAVTVVANTDGRGTVTTSLTRTDTYNVSVDRT